MKTKDREANKLLAVRWTDGTFSSFIKRKKDNIFLLLDGQDDTEGVEFKEIPIKDFIDDGSPIPSAKEFFDCDLFGEYPIKTFNESGEVVVKG